MPPLSLTHRTILQKLCSDRPVPAGDLVSALYADRRDGGPEDPHNVIRVEINRLRRRLAEVGVEIITIQGQGRMVHPDHRLIAANVVNGAGQNVL